MTGRERILAAFHGGEIDRAPFCPNIYYWFYRNLAAGTLPAAVDSARHPFDALRALGADILARWDTQKATKEVFLAGEYSEEYAGESGFARPLITAFNTYPAGRNQVRRRFETPFGTLTSSWTVTPEAGADFESEFWWKRWEEYSAIRYMLEARDYQFDAALFDEWTGRVGEDGVMMVHITQSPLKTFHWLAGAEQANFFLADHPKQMRELAEIHQAQALNFLEAVVDHPTAQIFISLENLDSFFYSPSLYHEYCNEFFRRAGRIIHSRGKKFVAHACGHNRILLPAVAAAGVDCLEGLTPPPLGDVPLAEARELARSPELVINGGIVGELLERADARERIFEYTRQLFQAMGDRRRFLFASSCSTPANARWENLEAFRDAAGRA